MQINDLEIPLKTDKEIEESVDYLTKAIQVAAWHSFTEVVRPKQSKLRNIIALIIREKLKQGEKRNENLAG